MTREPGAPFEIHWAAPARRALRRLPEKAATAVIEFVYGPLASNPSRVGRPLRFELEGVYSAHRGDYRVVYRIDQPGWRVEVLTIATGPTSTGVTGLWASTSERMRSPEALRIPEDCVSITITEGGSAVWCPGHLEDALGTFDASDTEARAEAFNALQIFNELLHCFPKPPLLLP